MELGIMTRSLSFIAAARNAAEQLGHHPQDHGWRDVYRLFAAGFAAGSPGLLKVSTVAHELRPEHSITHLITLLGIAIKQEAGPRFDLLRQPTPPEHRLELLEDVVSTRIPEIVGMLCERQNSFTGARRFLVPQAILGAYFSSGRYECSFADLGTGLGVLPRQLNSRISYETLGRELSWPDGLPPYRAIPLVARFGVDRPPLPSIEWVSACYGRSEYYAALLGELNDAQSVDDVRCAEVSYEEVDLLDLAALSDFLTRNHINAATISYVLYEIEPERRRLIIDAIRGSLAEPGVLLTMEPNDGLSLPGCTVTLYESNGVQSICRVSDGHFRGAVLPLEHYGAFASAVGLHRPPAYGSQHVGVA
jgi:hypothetical protein